MCRITRWPLIALAWLPFAGLPSNGAEPPEPVFWREHTFCIPFQIHRHVGDADAPSQMLLHAATEPTGPWSHVGTAGPTTDHFVYQAPRDGTYWFALVTLDSRGRVLSGQPLRPQLGVVIDTVPPRIDLQTREGTGGEVQIHWTAVDPHLDVTSLKIETRSDPNATWTVLALSPADPNTSQLSKGATTWMAPSGAELVWIRAEVSDLAGNPSSTVRQLVLSGHGTRARSSRSPSPPVTRHAGAPPSARPPATRPGPALSDTQRTEPDRPEPKPAVDQVWPPTAISNAPFTVKPTTPHGPQMRMASSSTANVNPPSGPRRYQQPPRWINTSHVELTYDVAEVGPGGVGKVEVWGTRDGGRTWSSYGVDNDRRSPVRVLMPEDGVIGMRIVVQSVSGVGGRRPAAGDIPEVWVGVDRNPPWARIHSTELRNDGGERRLLIRWEAQDDHLKARPISLSMSPFPGGPWSPIASGLRNTGLYVWPLRGDLPEQVYLRLDVEDEANNAFSFETPRPVSLTPHAPEGTIRQIGPAGRSAEKLLEYRRF